MDSINIDKESFIQAHQTLIVANNILEGLVTSIKSVSCDGLPAELSSRFDGVKSNLELCYSGDDSYSLSSILNKIDEFIYKNASLDDFFMMYYSSSEMDNMQQSLVNGDGEEIYSQYVQFLNELYSMGVFNEEEYNEYMYGAESMKNNEYDFSYLQPYYNSIYQKANDLYLNGLYKYYHDSETDNSLLIGNITIEELYNATNAKLSEGPKRDYNKGFDAWRRDYGIDLDEAIFENSEEFKEYAALSRRLVMDDDLNDEELKRLDELSKYVDGYSERLDSEMALLWEKTGYTTGSMVQETFIDPGICLATGFISGVASVAENIIDGAAMLTVGTYAWIANDENTKQWLQTNVGTNWSQEGYYYLTQDCLKAKEDTVDFGYTGSMVGSMGGYMLLGSATSSILWLDLLTSGLAGAGQGGQSAIESGANFDQAYGTTLIAGGAAVIADFGFSRLGGANRAVATLGGAALASGEQGVNTAAQYLIYGQYLTDENGERLYTSYHDFMKKTGGYINTILAAPVGAFRGNQSYTNREPARIDAEIEDAFGGAESYKGLRKYCEEHGYDYADYIYYTKLASTDLSDSQLRMVLDTTGGLVSDVTDANGILNEGVMVSKTAGADALRWIKDGGDATVGGCTALQRDTNFKTDIERIDALGLRYKDNPFVDKNGEINPYIVTEAENGVLNNSQYTLALRLTGSVDAYEGMPNDEWLKASNAERERIERLNPRKYETHNDDVTAANYPGNPALAHGNTLNQGDRSHLGLSPKKNGRIEFESIKGRVTVKNGSVYYYDGKGQKVKIYEIDNNGKYRICDGVSVVGTRVDVMDPQKWEPLNGR